MGKGVLKTEEFSGGNGAGNMQTKQLKRQLEVTQEDLYKMEKVNSYKWLDLCTIIFIELLNHGKFT